MDNEDAKREARSFPRLQVQLTELGGLICELWDHVRAAHHIVGLTVPDGLAPSPRNTEGPQTPMLWVFDDVHDLKSWVKKIDDGLDAPLRELVPKFYDEMDAEKQAKKKEPSEV